MTQGHNNNMEDLIFSYDIRCSCLIYLFTFPAQVKILRCTWRFNFQVCVLKRNKDTEKKNENQKRQTNNSKSKMINI